MVLATATHPPRWSLRPLAELAEIASGVTKGRDLAGQKLVSVPYLRVANVQAGALNLEEIKDIEVPEAEVERFRLLDGDVVMTEGGDPDKLGRGAVWRSEVPLCIHQNHIFRVRPISTQLDSNYLSRYLASPAARAYFLRCAKQTTGIASINKTQLSAFPVGVPPLPEQRRIAAILDHADALRAKRRQALGTLDALTQSIFLDMFGDPVDNRKKLPSAALGDLLEGTPQNGLYKPSTDYGSGTPILRIDSFYSGVVGDLASLKRVRLDEKERSLFGLSQHDVVINRVNSLEYLGKSALIPALDEATVFESNMMRIRLDDGRLDPCYLVQLLQTDYTKRYFMKCAKKAVNQASINQKDVCGLRVLLPPVENQRQFKRRAEQVAACLSTAQASLAKLDALFASLQYRAFRGEL
jgi:type I restriction enzyme, S subunit